MTQTASVIPIIDIRGIHSPDIADRVAVARAIRAACMDKGFFYIQGHGVPESLQKDLFGQSRAFFALPDEIKRNVDKARSPANHGYEPMRGQRLEAGAHPDLKEGYYIGREMAADHPHVLAGRFNHGPNLWPDGMPAFKQSAERYFEVMDTLAVTLVRSLSLALELPESYFDDFCHEGLATMRLLHYPPQPADSDSATRGAGAHTDFGCITILLQDGIGGLQVYDRVTDGWIDAPPVPGTFVINLGDLIERWTNGRFASTRHRVINLSGGERYSIAFFFSGNPDYRVACLPNCLAEGEIPKYPPTTVDQHLRECYRRTYKSL